jgi:glycosyltransferase involved in cell wall biosynthesis
MACGTPIVAFRTFGIPDLVRPGVTGYLAEPENAEDLCRGIVQLIEDAHSREHLSGQCRATAVKEYPVDLEVQRHIELYHRLLQN